MDQLVATCVKYRGCCVSVGEQKLIRMNMPVDDKGTVHFKTTLFALIRESLSIRMGPGDLLACRFLHW